MRTKNKKWTVPILAIVPVLALAAFLAAGLLTPNNAEALEEGACGFTTDDATTFTSQTDDDDSNSGVQCQVLEDSVTVTIENMDDMDKANVVVLVSGGNDYPNLQALDDAADNSPDEIGKKGVGEMSFSVDEQELVGRKNVPGMATFTVTSSMAKGGEVFIALYNVSTGDTLTELDDDPPTWPNDSITSELTIVFLGAPSLTQPDAVADDDGNQNTPDDEDEDPNDVTDPSSTFAVDIGDDSVGITMAEEAMYTISDEAVSQATIVATIKDGNGLLLKDGDDDIDSGVVFSYEYAMGSDLKSRRSLTGTEDVDVENDGTASLVLDEWKSGDKPVSVTVSAMYSGPTGSLDLGEITLSRSGTAKTVMAATFSMDCLVDKDAATDTDDPTGYTDDTFVKPADDNECEMDSRFGSKQVIVVKAHLEDALGSVVAGTLSVALDDDMDDPIDPDDNPTSLTAENTPGESSVWVYEIDKDAMLGDHMITVSFDDDDVADVVLTVAVAGPPMSYMISGPDNIDLGGRGMFTVTAVDANDGVPHFITTDGDDDKNDTVEIVVPDIAESLVRGSMLDAGTLTLDEDTGMGTFTIYAPSNAADGSTARIFVSAGDVEITHTVTFGAATPGEGEMPTLMAPTNVAASSFGASKTVGVSWTPGRGAQQHIAVLFSSDGSIIVDVEYLGATADSHTFRDVASGDYLAVVASFRSGQMFMYDGFKEVTVQ